MVTVTLTVEVASAEKVMGFALAGTAFRDNVAPLRAANVMLPVWVIMFATFTVIAPFAVKLNGEEEVNAPATLPAAVTDNAPVRVPLKLMVPCTTTAVSVVVPETLAIVEPEAAEAVPLIWMVLAVD